jgi:hypothetical protein
MGLMSRVLSSTGKTSGKGLLRRALELRSRVQSHDQTDPAGTTLETRTVVEGAAAPAVDTQKKKPLNPFSAIFALTLKKQSQFS